MDKKIKVATFDDYKKRLFKDPKFVLEYEALGPEYDVIRQIIKARIEKGITQAKLAQVMKTKQSVISRLERGVANPSLNFLKRLAGALNLRLEVRFS